MSAEHKAAISKALTGKKRGPMSLSARKKMSEVHKGKKLSDATKAALSASVQAFWDGPNSGPAKEAAAKRFSGPKTEEHQRKINESRAKYFAAKKAANAP